jgi:hypothetical protein
MVELVSVLGVGTKGPRYKNSYGIIFLSFSLFRMVILVLGHFHQGFTYYFYNTGKGGYKQYFFCPG